MLVKRFFSATEAALFLALPPQQQFAAFLRLWTRKEAWLKATGMGISELLHKVEVTFREGDAARFVALPDWARAFGAWQLLHLEPASGYLGALAVPEAVHNILLWYWRPEFP
jgi:4'-phosphopantetheinyl transferase